MKRIISVVLSLAVSIASLFGLALMIGLLQKKPMYEAFGLFETILLCMAVIYYFINFLYMRRRKRGVFFPVWKFAIFISMTASTIYSWLFLSHFFQILEEPFKSGVLFCHFVVAILVLLEWLVAEKGHFWPQFTWAGLAPFVVYIIIALINGYYFNGIGVQGMKYPYPFLNVEQLGLPLVLETCGLMVLALFLYCRLVIFMDQRLYDSKNS